MINYIDCIIAYLGNVPQCEQLYYISGKWFYKNSEIKNIINFIVSSDLFTNIESRSRFFGNIKTYRELQEWIENYKLIANNNVDNFGKWKLLPYQDSNYLISYFKDNKELYDNLHRNMPIFINFKEYVLLHSLLFEPNSEYLYIVYGIAGSGKSTFLNVIGQLFDNDISSTNISDLSKDFLLANAITKRLIMSDELNGNDINNASLKTLISHQKILANPKFEKPFQCVAQSQLIFSTNKIPYFDISDSGLLRRIIYYVKNQKIKKPDTSKNKIILNKEQLLAIAFKAYLTDDSVGDVFENETHEVLKINNSVYLSNTNDYELYKNFCIKKGYKAFNERNFTEIYEVFKSWELKK